MVLSRRNSFTNPQQRHQSGDNNNTNNYYHIQQQQQHYHFWPSMSSIAERTSGRQNGVVVVTADDASTSSTTRLGATIPRRRTTIIGGEQTTVSTVFSDASTGSSPDDAAADSPLLRSANRRLSGMTLANAATGRRPPFRNIVNTTGGGGGSRQLFQRGNTAAQMTRRSLQFFDGHRSATMATTRKRADDGNSPPPMLDDRQLFRDDDNDDDDDNVDEAAHYHVQQQKQQILLFDGNHHFRRTTTTTTNHGTGRRQSSAFESAPSHKLENIVAHHPAIMMSSAMAMRKRRASYDIGSGGCHRMTLPSASPLLSEATFERLNVGAGGGGAAAAPPPTHRTRDFVRADVDKCVHLDARALSSLLRLDALQIVDPRTVRALQTEIREPQRRAAVVELTEMCRRFDADVSVLPLAVAFMDRMLAAQFLPRRNVGALAGAALLLASKMKAPRPIAAEQIVRHAAATPGGGSGELSGGISGVGELRDWEMFVLNKLSYNLGTITAFEFLDQLLVRAPILENLRESFAGTLTAMFKDLQLACLPASHQAAACLLYVADESGRMHLVREAEAAIQRCFDVDTALCRATYATNIRFALSDFFFDNDTAASPSSVLRREDGATVPSFVPEAKSSKRSLLSERLADYKGPLVASEEVIVETGDEADENDEAMLTVGGMEEDGDEELEKFIIHNVSDEPRQTDIRGLTWSFNAGCVAEDEEEVEESGDEGGASPAAQNGREMSSLLMMMADGKAEPTSTALPQPPLHFTVVDAEDDGEEDANARHCTELDISLQQKPQLDFRPAAFSFASSLSYQSSASATSSLPYLYCDESSNNSNSSDGYGSSVTSNTTASVCALTTNAASFSGVINCRVASVNDSGFSSTVSTPEADAAPQQTTTLTTTTTMTTVTCSGSGMSTRPKDPLPPPPPLCDIPLLLLTDEELTMRDAQHTRKQNFYGGVGGAEEFAVFRRHQGFGQLF